jgi:thioesterase domain-containing protein
MAADYIEKMRTVQEEGAWYVGGWSFGGAVAYEIVRQLEAAGETVALLVAIDADALEGRLWNDLNEAFLKNLRAAFPQASLAIAPLADKSRENQLLLNRVGRYRHALADIKAATPEYIRLAILGWEELGQEQLIKLLKKVVSYADSLASYVPGERVNVAVEDFRATAGDTSMVADSWKSLVSGPVRSHRLEGDHRTILTSPGVSTLAARLREALEEPMGPGSPLPYLSVAASGRSR